MIRYWTEAEEARLREHYARTPIRELSAALGRSRDAIRHRAKMLGLQTFRLWTEQDRARLREAWGKVRTVDLARELGRRPLAVKQQAMKLGLASDRFFTAAEITLVRELYLTHTAAQISVRIWGQPHSAGSIHRLAARLGLRKWPAWPAEVIERVRALHAGGLTDAGIFRRMPDVFEDRLQVKNIRHDRLKLPVNTAAVKACLRENVAKQHATLGIRNTGELRTLFYRRYARENGWPEELRPREVQILNVLAARGVPMTNLELAGAIGMRTDRVHPTGSPALLTDCGRDGTYTAGLTKRGYLVRIRGGTGRGGSTRGPRDLYVLGPVAIEILERRAACQKTETAGEA